MAPAEPGAAAAPADESPDPTIARFLRRYPGLRQPVAETLARAAAVRAARRRALPPGLPTPGPRRRDAEDALRAAAKDLEELARSPSPAAGDVRGAVDRVLAAALGLRLASHAFSPRRKAASPAARTALARAVAAFNGAFAELEAAANAAGALRLPWQIELATHVAPGTQVREMEVTGYDLPRTPAARRAWGERCWLSGGAWNTDSHASPALRYRSLDACSHTLAPRYHALFARLRAALDVLRSHGPEAVERIARALPMLYEERVAATASNTFAGLGLLDFPSLAVVLNNLLRAYAERPLFGSRGRHGHFPTLGVADRGAVARSVRSGYAWETYGEVRTLALALARGFEGLGLGRGERLGIVAAQNSREPYLADFAAIFAGLVVVPLAATRSRGELAAAVEQTGLRAAVTDGASLPRCLEIPALELLVLFGDAGPPPGGRHIVTLASLLAEETPEAWTSASGISPATGILYGDADGYRTAAAAGIRQDSDDDVYAVLFTSGSTGRPKGTIVTRRRWAEEMCFEANVWPLVGVSFQPSATAADHGAVWRTLANGGRVGFARRGAALFDDVRAVRPTALDAPPVVWNALYGEYKRAASDPALTRSEAAALRYCFKQRLGGRLAFIAVGGAASDPGVRRTMEEIFEVPMRESYGTTETGNVAADGELLPGLDYRLVDLPELGYTARDQPYPRGELAVRTPHTTRRYLDGSDGFTADGYFLTGDVVEIGPGRRVTILGRRAPTFKLAGSELVSPEALERHYLTSELVEAVLITASPLASTVAAVAVPARGDVTEAELAADFRAIARREGLRPCDVPAAVVVAPRTAGGLPWTAENGMLTPSLKLDRRALEARYRDAVDAAYARAQAAREEAAATAAAARDLETVTRQLVRIVAALTAVAPEDVDARRSFADHGGGSLAAMELVLRLEQVFTGKGMPRSIAAGDPEEVATAPLAEVARHILAQRRAPAPPPAVPPPAGPVPRAYRSAGPAGGEQAALANADAARGPLPDPLPPVAAGRHVLLTGATGFLGVHLLHRLASTLPAGRRIYALVRAADDGAARKRLAGALRGAVLEIPRGADVVALAGSLSEDRLGLADGVYERLASELGLIYHAAAEVSFDKSYAELRSVNVVGTRRLLELAAATALKSFHLVSSLNVALLLRQPGGRRAGEESPLPARLTPETVAAAPGYGVAKWVCERMVERLYGHCRGAFRASVSRPALIGWSRATGCANLNDWLSRVLVSCLVLRRAIGPAEAGVPRWVPETAVSTRGLDLVPVDYAARAIGRLGELTRAAAWPDPSRPAPLPSPPRVPTFHVSNVAPAEAGLVTLPRLMDLLIAADLRCGGGSGKPIERVPFADWTALAEIESAPVLPVLGQLRRMSPLLERTAADRFAAAMAGEEDCPAVDQALVEAYVRWWYAQSSGA